MEALSFPLVLAGNCMNSVGVACALGPKDIDYLYFDAHDDLHTPNTNVHGYFDAMGLPVLAGESFHAPAKNIPGFEVTEFGKNFLFCGKSVHFWLRRYDAQRPKLDGNTMAVRRKGSTRWRA